MNPRHRQTEGRTWTWSRAAWLLSVAGMAAGVRADGLDDAQRAQRNLNAVQTIYRQGVPHTDRRGQVLMAYDPQRSFFQRGLWGVPLPTELHGHRYRFETLVEAGFNTVWPWYRDEEALPVCEQFGLQAVLMHPLSQDFARQVANHPALLGNCWMDEPLGQWDRQQELFDEFVRYRERIKAVAPGLPVFINQVPWITAPATSWWVKWNTESDISCHDNYPFMHRRARVRSIAEDPNMTIPGSVGLAVASSLEKKPVWLIVGAFTDTQPPGSAFPFRFPTPEQLRACVYAGIIHGATGIVYFTWDTWISRDGGVIGMSADPQVTRAPWPKVEGTTNPTPATPMQLVQSRACWDAAAQINRELAELTPVLLSPTVGPEVGYTVDVQGEAPTPTPIRCLLKPHPEGGYVLLTVNCDDAVLAVNYTFPQALAQVQPLYENRDPLPLQPGDRSFTLMYEPFDTHVVRIMPQALGAPGSEAESRQDNPQSSASGGVRPMEGITIKADGVTDDTAAIQAALDAAAETGGKVILPPGKYLVAGSLTVPEGVALEGAANAPRYNRPLTGTVILATGGRDQEDGPALFEMGDSTSVSGLTVYYPEQKADDIHPYAWTFHLQGCDNTVENVTLINSYNGIRVGDGPQWNVRHRIRSVYGCTLRRGIYVNGCSDVGRIDNVHLHGHWWWAKEVGGAPDNPDGSLGLVNRYLMDNLEAFIIGRSDWEYITNTFVFIAKTGYRFIKTPLGASSCQMVGVGADAVQTCVLVEGIVSWWTLLITHGQFASDARDPTAVGVRIERHPEPACNGSVRLVNCSILAPQGVVSHNPKVTSLQDCYFNVWGPTTNTPLIQADDGTLQVTGCNFEHDRGAPGPPAPSIEIARPLQFALITGNVGQGGVKIVNRGVPDGNVIIANNQPATF